MYLKKKCILLPISLHYYSHEGWEIVSNFVSSAQERQKEWRVLLNALPKKEMKKNPNIFITEC